MIKYSLICKSCDLTFESWFASSKEYEKLKKKNFLNCHICNSTEVEKSLMAPNLISKKSNVIKNKNIEISIDVGSGNKYFTAYTMDLTKKYIEINADYRS